jgi:steroid delta-isomerase-like uncharacterized protein
MSPLTPPAQATNGELARWAFERLNDHDVDSLRQFWSADTVEYFPTGTCHGADEIAAYFTTVFEAVPDFSIEPLSIVADGDDVFVHWRLTGTHSGRFLGVDGTGRAVDLQGIDHFVISDGLVVSNTVRFDQMEWARQIGLLPPDGSPADRAMKAAFNARTKVAHALHRRSA